MLHIDISPACASAPCGVHRRNVGISGRCDGREISNGAGALCRQSCFPEVGCCFHDVFFLESHQLTPTTPSVFMEEHHGKTHRGSRVGDPLVSCARGRATRVLHLLETPGIVLRTTTRLPGETPTGPFNGWHHRSAAWQNWRIPSRERPEIDLFPGHCRRNRV